MKSNLKVAFVALGLIAFTASPAHAEGGRGDDKSGEGTAIDFFGYFLAGGNPFAAVSEIENDAEEARMNERSSNWQPMTSDAAKIAEGKRRAEAEARTLRNEEQKRALNLSKL